MAGTVKAFKLPIDYVLYDMSYANVVMYSACLPSFSAKRKGKSKDHVEVIDADDPRNRSKVREILNGD